jgi:glycosyltransferase involved in cell wall biosynthesis
MIRDQLVASGVSRARVQVLHNGIDIAPPPESRESLRAALGLNPSDLVVGSVSRLSTEKGHRDLLQAVAQLGRGELRLLLGGDGPEREALQRMARDLGLTDQVRFLGVRHDVERLYPAFDVFALPSHTEGSPTALLEAFAYGVPALATRVGAVPDMLQDGEEGVLVPPQAPGRLADGLGKLFASGGVRQRLAEGAKRRYEAEFRRDHWLDSITSAYRELSGLTRAARHSDSSTGANRREDNGNDDTGRVMDHLAGRHPADPAEPSA